ncbi:hypothetical protein DY000_02055905 [Brassica cretica]|uniref:Leucine zipper homeobox-associated domain-containing protein n=1 Tax=Brassica cretica TaxID=69181 RepID=A0ABQ7A9V7_BRACR|nr:hypothetical protein DY000_02055905 [Brassica cretica]
MRQQIDWGCRFVLEISGGAFAMTDPRNGGYKSSMTTKSSKSDEEGGTHTSFGTKLKQTEVDCEYLKRCCDNLTEENRRLQKEVSGLRALKLSPNLYMQMTPTTLTMCPSCERVSASSSAVAAPPPPSS